jgi:hypothetical protein
MHADLRLQDLKERERTSSRLMNVKVPADVSDAIQRVARALGASKTDVVIALLNEGLAASEGPGKVAAPAKGVSALARRLCSVRGCHEPHVAKGYCAAHYQAARRGRLVR